MTEIAKDKVIDIIKEYAEENWRMFQDNFNNNPDDAHKYLLQNYAAKDILSLCCDDDFQGHQMTKNANEMIDNPVIAKALKLHGLDRNTPNQTTEVFILGFFSAWERCLKSIADIGPNENEDIMTGHEDAFRAVETLFVNKDG